MEDVAGKAVPALVSDALEDVMVDDYSIIDDCFHDSLEWLQSQLRLTGFMFIDHYRRRAEELRVQHRVGNMPSGLEREA